MPTTTTTSPSTHIHLRTATHADIPPIASLLGLSFAEEELHAYLFPHRDQFPTDYFRTWRQAVRERWWAGDRVWVVVEEDSEGGGGGGGSEKRRRLVGVAEWQRCGLGWRTATTLWGGWGWRGWRLKPLISRILHYYHLIYRFIRPDRSARHPSPSDTTPLSKANFPHRIAPFMSAFYPYEAYWELCTLGVHPAARGRGYGRRLVEWGLMRARGERLPACVVCAKDTEGFYQRCGFEVFLGRCSEVEIEGMENPLMERGLGGGAVLYTKCPI